MSRTAKSGSAPGGELLRTTLQQIPTVFGRLVYLSSLRDLQSGRYEHDAMARMFGREDTDRALRHNHRQVFSQWLESSLEEQKDDLKSYLSAAAQSVCDPSGELEESTRFRSLIPPAAREVERLLYLTDLDKLRQLLTLKHSVSSSNPEA